MIYLDNHATTKLADEVLQEMLPYMSTWYGNSSSTHAFGLQAREAVEHARQIIAGLINARPDQVFFTSGATESNNTILRGGNIILTSTIEHASVIQCSNQYKQRCNIRVERNGELSDFDERIEIYKGDSSLVICSIHAANNEIGTVYNVGYIGRKCLEHDILFHTDATQAIGKVKIDVEEQHIDALSFSAHKIHGPKGIGVLYVRRPHTISPLLLGGLQDKIRSGTLNVPSIIGTAKALQMACEFDWSVVKALRDQLYQGLLSEIPDLELNGGLENRLPNNLNVSIPGIKSEVFVKGMTDVILSSGSACKSGQDKPSDVLLAIQAPHPDCAIRFGLSRYTTKEEIEYTIERVTSLAKEVRKI